MTLFCRRHVDLSFKAPAAMGPKTKMVENVTNMNFVYF